MYGRPVSSEWCRLIAVPLVVHRCPFRQGRQRADLDSRGFLLQISVGREQTCGLAPARRGGPICSARRQGATLLLPTALPAPRPAGLLALPVLPRRGWARKLAPSHRRVKAAGGERSSGPRRRLGEAAEKTQPLPAAVARLPPATLGGHDPAVGQS